MPPSSPSRSLFRKDYVPELDGLRAIAVLLVLWVHLPPFALGPEMLGFLRRFAPGNVGVDLFFVLSGFLITRILLVDREAGVPLRLFLIRRFLRIFPIYYLTLVAMHPRLTGAELLTCATYTSNYGLLFSPGVCGMDHSWSLSVEEHFYILWPPVVAFLSPRVSFRILLLIFPVALASIVGTVLLGDWAKDAAMLNESLLRTSNVRFASLALGAVVAYRETWLRTHRAAALGIALVSAAGCWALSEGGLRTLGLFPLLKQIPSTLGNPANFLTACLVIAVPLGSVAAVIVSVAFTGTWMPHCILLRARILRSIGRISYGLYLYHFPIFTAGVWGPSPHHPPLMRVALVLALCFGVAALSYHLVERPLLELGARFRAPRAVVPPEPAEARVPAA